MFNQNIIEKYMLNDSTELINCFVLVKITATLTFISFYFEQNTEKLIENLDF